MAYSISVQKQQEIIQHLSQDSILKTVIEKVPFPNPHSSNDLHLYMLEAILNQQLSFRVAAIIYERFINLFDGYPLPHQLLDTKDESLKAVGLSRQKIAYLKNVAAFTKEQELTHDALHKMDDEAIISHLTTIKGVGRWTVEMVLMFPLNREDVFPVDDLGIQNTIKMLYGIKEEGKLVRKKLNEIAVKWAPYRTWACKYLWDYSD